MSSNPKKYSLEELAAIVNDNERAFRVVLHKAQTWMDCESAAFLTGEANIVAVDASQDWPLQVSFSNSVDDSQPVPFDGKMEFVCKP